MRNRIIQGGSRHGGSVITRFEVRDFELWTRGFDVATPLRETPGFRSARCCRDVDEPARVSDSIRPEVAREYGGTIEVVSEPGVGSRFTVRFPINQRGAEYMSMPQKTRELHNHHFDSTVWNDFDFREDDIIIATYAKSGTTWVQQIVGQLIFGAPQDLEVAHLSPWVDLRVPPKEVKLSELRGQTHRRFVKTHLPVDALVFSPEAKYLYVARDGRDVVWSMFNHHTNANEKWYGALNDTPGLVGPKMAPPPEDVREYFLDWLDKDGHPFWPFWENTRTWWAIRDLPNVKTLHFADLKADMPGEIRSIADFLEIPIDESKWDMLLTHCSFDYMKANAAKSAPLGGTLWEGGAKTFMHKGTNGRWRDLLTADDIARYEARAIEELGAECAAWLARGSAQG